MKQMFPTCSTLCVDAQHISSLPKIASMKEKLLHVQCIISTSILQVSPHDWKPDAVIVIRADSSLSIPDWKVSEHCYHMLENIIQQYPCPVIIQAYSIGHHAIQAACRHNDELFWNEENAYRKDF